MTQLSVMRDAHSTITYVKFNKEKLRVTLRK